MYHVLSRYFKIVTKDLKPKKLSLKITWQSGFIYLQRRQTSKVNKFWEFNQIILIFEKLILCFLLQRNQMWKDDALLGKNVWEVKGILNKTKYGIMEYLILCYLAH